LHEGAKTTQVELVHLVITYSVLLLTEQGSQLSLSVASLMLADFRDSVVLGRQPRTNLHDLCQGWLGSMVTVSFALAENAEYAAARSDALRECGVLHEEIAHLRTLAAKERQISRQVELNLELKLIEAALATTKQKL
jgi:Domain of unknown function (DUF4391)